MKTKTIFLVLFMVVLNIYSNDYLSLSLGDFRTYKQIFTGTIYFLTLTDSLFDTLTINGLKAYKKQNKMKVDSVASKIKSSALSYWYERNDTIFAATAMDSIGKPPSSDVEIVQAPIIFGKLDSSSGSPIRYEIYDSLASYSTPSGVYGPCARKTEYNIVANGIYDTLQVTIDAKKIGTIYFKDKTSWGYLISYNVSGAGSLSVRPGTKILSNGEFDLKRNNFVFDIFGKTIPNNLVNKSSNVSIVFKKNNLSRTIICR
jgi:hypothetical protein